MKAALVKVIENTLHIAEYRVAAPAYTIFVRDAISAFGWEHLEEDANAEVIKSWASAEKYEDPVLDIFATEETANRAAYCKGDIVFFKGQLWVSISDKNSSEPADGENWKLAVEKAKDWKEGESYDKGDIITIKNNLWVSIKEKNSDRIGEKSWKQVINFYPVSEEAQGLISIGKGRVNS